jgi:hypothetical protein
MLDYNSRLANPGDRPGASNRRDPHDGRFVIDRRL